jgi:hypothetical protein
MHGLGLPLEQVAELHPEDVDDTNPRAVGNDGRDGFEVRVVLVRGQEDELPDAR